MVRSTQSTTFAYASKDEDDQVLMDWQENRMRVSLDAVINQHLLKLIFDQPHSRPIVSYYFPKGVGDYHYGVRILF